MTVERMDNNTQNPGFIDSFKHAWATFKELNGLEQFVVALSSTLGLAFGLIGGPLVFRAMVNCIHPAARKTNQVVKQTFKQDPAKTEALRIDIRNARRAAKVQSATPTESPSTAPVAPSTTPTAEPSQSEKAEEQPATPVASQSPKTSLKRERENADFDETDSPKRTRIEIEAIIENTIATALPRVEEPTIDPQGFVFVHPDESDVLSNQSDLVVVEVPAEEVPVGQSSAPSVSKKEPQLALTYPGHGLPEALTSVLPLGQINPLEGVFVPKMVGSQEKIVVPTVSVPVKTDAVAQNIPKQEPMLALTYPGPDWQEKEPKKPTFEERKAAKLAEKTQLEAGKTAIIPKPTMAEELKARMNSAKANVTRLLSAGPNFARRILQSPVQPVVAAPVAAPVVQSVPASNPEKEVVETEQEVKAKNLGEVRKARKKEKRIKYNVSKKGSKSPVAELSMVEQAVAKEKVKAEVKEKAEAEAKVKAEVAAKVKVQKQGKIVANAAAEAVRNKARAQAFENATKIWKAGDKTAQTIEAAKSMKTLKERDALIEKILDNAQNDGMMHGERVNLIKTIKGMDEMERRYNFMQKHIHGGPEKQKKLIKSIHEDKTMNATSKAKLIKDLESEFKIANARRARNAKADQQAQVKAEKDLLKQELVQMWMNEEQGPEEVKNVLYNDPKFALKFEYDEHDALLSEIEQIVEAQDEVVSNRADQVVSMINEGIQHGFDAIKAKMTSFSADEQKIIKSQLEAHQEVANAAKAAASNS